MILNGDHETWMCDRVTDSKEVLTKQGAVRKHDFH
jgi:hypothetical protein